MGKVTLTTFKEVVHRADLEDTLHVLVQDADLRLPIGVDDKLYDKRGRLSNSGGCSDHTPARGERTSAPQGRHRPVQHPWNTHPRNIRPVSPVHLSSWAHPAQTE